MDKKQIKAIIGSIKKLTHTDNFDLLRLVTSKIELEIDSDYVYFNYIDGARPIRLLPSMVYWLKTTICTS